MEKTTTHEEFGGQPESFAAECETCLQSALSGLKLTLPEGQEIACAGSCPVVAALVKELVRLRTQAAQLKQMYFGRSSEKANTLPGGPKTAGSALNGEDGSCPPLSSETPVESGQASGGKAEDRSRASCEHERGDADTAEEPKKAEGTGKKRGARQGHKGHGRRIPNNLAEEHIVIRVPDELRVCPRTGEEGEPLPPSFWEVSSQIDIRITAVRQVFHREKLKFDCEGCPAEVRSQCVIASSARRVCTSSPSFPVTDDEETGVSASKSAEINDGGTCPDPGTELVESISGGGAALAKQSAVDAMAGTIRQAGPRTMFVSAPQPPQAVDKSKLSMGSFAILIFFKYFLALPLTRISTLLAAACRFELNPSTMICTFKHHKDLLEALYQRMAEEVRKFSHINVDETRWMSFFHRKGKTTYMDWMWVMASEKVVLYVLDRSRSSTVLFKWLGDAVQGVVSADRAHAYKKYAREVAGVLLSFCWAHFRRDFVRAAVGNALLRPWARRWIGRIFKIYRLNRERLKVLGDPIAFPIAQARLEEAIKHLFNQIKEELEAPNLYAAQREVLESAIRHWAGLTVFVSDPLVPLDNNRAERLLRVIALARKNFYGTYADWSGRFTAYCLTIIQTAIMHGLEPMAYIKYYLEACAKAGGVPTNLEPLLPWNIPPELRERYGMSLQKEETPCCA
jgi:hypothetical protein